MEKNQIYVFLDKTKEGVFYFTGAVWTRKQAKGIIKDCIKAELKIDYTKVNVQDEEDKNRINGLFLLLESRYSDGKFAPTGTVIQNEDDAKRFLQEEMMGMPRKYEEIYIMKPGKVLKKIFQNS